MGPDADEPCGVYYDEEEPLARESAYNRYVEQRIDDALDRRER
ncbi:hypothetical protein [Corynebacterium sp. 11A]|nr:hypothetical protein [Corynebacterium sp. 11A]